MAVCLSIPAPVTCAQSPPSEPVARKLFTQTRTEFNRAQTNAAAAWKLGRAAFDLAEFMTDDSERTQVSNTGVEACRLAIALAPETAPAHYYLALNLGELARSKKLGALRILHQMEQSLQQARRLDQGFDYAGSDRSLGILYREAPPWPLAVGNRNKARAHLEAAVQQKPEYPENYICLGEAYAKWSEAQNLDRVLRLLNDSLPRAQQRFAGDQWSATWRDWQERIRQLQTARDRLLVTPRISPAERGAKGVR